MINLANPRANRDAVNFYTCRDLISLWLPKTRNNTTSQVFTSLNDSILTDMLDPIKPTDGVNKRYLEARLKELENRLVDKQHLETRLKENSLRVLSIVVKVIVSDSFRECGRNIKNSKQMRTMVMKNIEKNINKLMTSEIGLDDEDITIDCPAAIE